MKTLRDRLRAQLADRKMPGSLEALDSVLAHVDGGKLGAGEAISQVLDAQISLRNNRRLKAAMRSSRLPSPRVNSLRNHHGIPVYDPARREKEGWLTLEEAAAELRVSPPVVRRLRQQDPSGGKRPAKRNSDQLSI